jgi:ElaB/YqjD/DUF883 family membrane-anchored ribosome-binding protein
MQNQFKPHIEASTNSAFEFANLAFSQVERLTALSVEQAKISAELAYDQAKSLMEVKDPTAAIELFKTQMETSTKSLAGYATTVLELGEEFQTEAATFVEGHFEEAHAKANKAINELLKNAPLGSEALVTAAKAAIDAANKAIAEAQTVAKKTTEMAKQGVAELKKHAPSAAPKTTGRRKARA